MYIQPNTSQTVNEGNNVDNDKLTEILIEVKSDVASHGAKLDQVVTSVEKLETKIDNMASKDEVDVLKKLLFVIGGVAAVLALGNHASDLVGIIAAILK